MANRLIPRRVPLCATAWTPSTCLVDHGHGSIYTSGRKYLQRQRGPSTRTIADLASGTAEQSGASEVEESIVMVPVDGKPETKKKAANKAMDGRPIKKARFAPHLRPIIHTPDPHKDDPASTRIQQSSSTLLPTYARPNVVMVRGRGCYLYDSRNIRYLDFTAGIAVNSLGHNAKGVCEALKRQAEKLWHVSNLYHNTEIGLLSDELVNTTKSASGMHDASHAFICNSGTEANEAAIKLARKVGSLRDPSGEKHEFVSFENAFHGRTMGALSATPNPKYQKPFAPMVPGFKVGKYNDVAGIDALVTEKTCGVIVEPIQGEGGIIVGDPAFMEALALRCRHVGAVLIHDEIQCGMSRTGKLWAHCHLPRAAHPDIITTAKALGNGFPIGAAIVNRSVADAIQIGDHGTTFGGNPLACSVALHVLERLAHKNLLNTIPRKSARFTAHFARLQEKYPSLILSWRGKGLILGLQLSQDPSPIVTAARERGLLIITAGHNTLRIVPPLVIREGQIDDGMAILEEAMRVVVEQSGSESAPRAEEVVHGEVDSPN